MAKSYLIYGCERNDNFRFQNLNFGSWPNSIGSTRNNHNFLLHVWVEDDLFFNLNGAAQKKNIS